MSDGLLVKQEKYLETGIHIGTKLRTIDMVNFIYRTRNDGLYVLDLRQIDERIRLAGKVLAKYNEGEVVIIASRTYSSISAKVFAQLTGAKVVSGRFVPGVFTNVARDDFLEPKLVFVCDPKGERQAVVECGKMGIPTIGLCDTDNFTMFVDWAIPCNNKGRRALALIFWLLAREIAMGKGKISSYDEFTPDFEAFEALANQIAETDDDKKSAVAEEAPESAQAEGEAPVEETAEDSGASKSKEGKEAESKDSKPKAKPKQVKKTAKPKAKPKAKESEKTEEKEATSESKKAESSDEKEA